MPPSQPAAAPPPELTDARSHSGTVGKRPRDRAMIRLKPQPTSRRDEAALAPVPPAGQLDNIKAHLDLLLLALEASAGITSEAIVAACRELGLDGISDRVGLWRLRQANPHRKSSGGRKKLDVDEARGLVRVVCHLARQHRDTLRQTVTLLERASEGNANPQRVPQLADYCDRFAGLYAERMDAPASAADLEALAFKLLVNLLFYSAPQGHRRLWLALI